MNRFSLARFGLTVLVLGVFTGTGRSQTTLFEEDFETGMSGWTGTGMWHWIPSTDPCGQSVSPYPSSAGAVRFGVSDCTYSDGNNPVQGSLISPAITLPEDAGLVSLTYFQFIQTELCAVIWDMNWLSISVDGGASFVPLTQPCLPGELLGTSGVWGHFKVDLTAWKGNDVLLSFNFDSVDGSSNDTLGWLLDDIQVVGEGCETDTYCFGSANSFSTGGAAIGYLGSIDVPSNDFTLTVDAAPPGQFGLFFYGGGTQGTSAGDGVLCVAAGMHSIVRLPAAQVGPTGRLEQSLDLAGTAAGPNAIVAGSVWHFQFWYRDVLPGGLTTFNFSDALSVAFCP